MPLLIKTRHGCGLGDAIESALSSIGVTSDRVTRLFGDCGCKGRKEILNSLGHWAARVLSGKATPVEAEDQLDTLLSEAAPDDHDRR